jgi:hypothetical protein
MAIETPALRQRGLTVVAADERSQLNLGVRSHP